MRINEIETTKSPTVRQLLKKYFKTTGKITVDSNGLVSCDGNVELKDDIIVNNLPVKFLHVGGYFLCNNNKLISLEGSPQIVGGGFYCNNDQLTSLKGGPGSVGEYWCNTNPLETLKGLPDQISDKLILTYSPQLPLMRALVANKILFSNRYESKDILAINNVLNKYAGQGKSGMMKCASELLTLGKELGVDLRQNARW